MINWESIETCIDKTWYANFMEQTQNIAPIRQNEPPTPIAKPQSRVPMFIIGFLTATTLISLSVAAYLYLFYERHKLDTIFLPNPVPQAETSPQPLAPVVGSNQLLLIKDPNREQVYDLQAWLINPEDNQQQQLPLTNIFMAYKYPASTTVYYTQDMGGTIKLLDLATNTTTTHTLIAHPQPDVDEGLTVSELDQIEPNGQAIVFQTMFTEPCPPVTVPPGFEGGFGPCSPDEDPNLPAGYYIYNFSLKKSTYLAQAIQVSRWDSAAPAFYFISRDYQKEGLYRFDLKTNSVDLVKKGESFGYAAFPLFKTNQMIEFEGNTGDSQAGSSSQLSLLNKDTGKVAVIDSGLWADIQPFAAINPDETAFIYLRSHHNNNGMTTDMLHLVDLKTLAVTQLTPVSLQDSYSIHGVWLNNHTFVTMVDTIETDRYFNGNNYLVKIDTENQQITKMTPQNDVYRFSTN